MNRRHHIYRQALWANRLDFKFHPAGPLSEVAGRTIEWKDIPWDVEIGPSRPDHAEQDPHEQGTHVRDPHESES